MSPLVLGRHDTERFLMGGEVVENFIARHQGPLVRRRGTQWVRSEACTAPRLVNFEFSREDSEMLQFGCEKIIVGADIAPTPPLSVQVTFSQYDGPFVMPAHAFKAVSPLDETIFFLSAYVSGDMVVKMSITPNNPANSAACSINTNTLFAYVYGLCEFAFDGGYQMYWDDATPRDPDDGSILGTGGLHVNLVRKGRVGAYNFHDNTPGTTTDHYADTWDGLMAAVAANGGVFCSKLLQYWQGEQFIQKYYSEDTTGYFVGGDITTFQACPDYEVDYRYTGVCTPTVMGLPVARTGSAARTQALTAYDDGTRTYTGTKSKANFTVYPGVGDTSVLGTLVFTVTPTVGDPYTLTRIADYDATFPTTPVAVEFPWIAGASVTLTSWSFTNNLSVFDDFENEVEDTEFILQESSPSWPFAGSFMCPSPNGGCYDDFEDGDDTETPLVSVTAGYGWAASGFFISKDPLNAYDDFESYTAGEITTSPNGGFGWASYSVIYAYNYLTAHHDFEDEVAGTTTTVVGGTNWEGDGFFI